jgi:hypothetical protein
LGIERLILEENNSILIPQLDKKAFSKSLKEMGSNFDDIKALSDNCFGLCQELDSEFDIPHD